MSVGEDCPECGGDLSKLGEDVTEELEYIPGRFVVNKIIRPRMACRRCEAVSQAPMPSRPIERGRPGPGLLAHVLVSKFADHLPLYRQSQIYAREGVDLDRSTMADWVGKSTALLEPLAEAIAKRVKDGTSLFADDTPLKMLAPRNKKKKNRPHLGLCPGRTALVRPITALCLVSVHNRLERRAPSQISIWLSGLGACRWICWLQRCVRQG